MSQSPRLSDDQLNRLAADIEQRPEVASLIGYPVVAAAFLDLRDARRADLARPTPSQASASNPDIKKEDPQILLACADQAAITWAMGGKFDNRYHAEIVRRLQALPSPAAPSEGKGNATNEPEQPPSQAEDATTYIKYCLDNRIPIPAGDYRIDNPVTFPSLPSGSPSGVVDALRPFAEAYQRLVSIPTGVFPILVSGAELAAANQAFIAASLPQAPAPGSQGVEAPRKEAREWTLKSTYRGVVVDGGIMSLGETVLVREVREDFLCHTFEAMPSPEGGAGR